MSITDELREFAKRWPRIYYIHRDVLAIADHIDNAALSERNAAYDKGYDEGFASADDWLADHEDAMAEHGWVRLPKDANGEYVHVGDVMEWPSGETFEVIGIGVDTLFYANDNDSMVADWTKASNKRHHKPDSWVQIIMDALKEGHNRKEYFLMSDSGISTADLVARCKALAGEE